MNAEIEIETAAGTSPSFSVYIGSRGDDVSQMSALFIDQLPVANAVGRRVGAASELEDEHILNYQTDLVVRMRDFDTGKAYLILRTRRQRWF